MERDKWDLHTQLEGVMKREIETMRQLLGNLHQEEMFILNKEKAYWSQMMEERANLIQQLSELRENLQILGGSRALEELLPADNQNSWEIFTLRDQILALVDRMNLQTSRNEMLTQLSHHQESLQPQQENKKKISIATETLEDYKNMDER